MGGGTTGESECGVEGPGEQEHLFLLRAQELGGSSEALKMVMLAPALVWAPEWVKTWWGLTMITRERRKQLVNMLDNKCGDKCNTCRQNLH